mmetsp:Transcript_726/g.1365  ORF Transcript_726/g.1365 Transcript_726/m.1365 type:complete len:359 (-) Transcript_726:636-1712(-)
MKLLCGSSLSSLLLALIVLLRLSLVVNSNDTNSLRNRKMELGGVGVGEEEEEAGVDADAAIAARTSSSSNNQYDHETLQELITEETTAQELSEEEIRIVRDRLSGGVRVVKDVEVYDSNSDVDSVDDSDGKASDNRRNLRPFGYTQRKPNRPGFSTRTTPNTVYRGFSNDRGGTPQRLPVSTNPPRPQPRPRPQPQPRPPSQHRQPPNGTTASGSLVWRYQPPSPVTSMAAIGSNLAIVGTNRGHLCLMDWTQRTRATLSFSHEHGPRVLRTWVPHDRLKAARDDTGLRNRMGITRLRVESGNSSGSGNCECKRHCWGHCRVLWMTRSGWLLSTMLDATSAPRPRIRTPTLPPHDTRT